MTADQIKAMLGLRPLAREGGYYAETYRSATVLGIDVPQAGCLARRALATAIFYLLTPDSFSALHRLAMDEIYHFYLGDPVEMLLLHSDGSSKTVVLGSDISRDMRLQTVVAAGVWQGSRLVKGGRFALMGTTTAPGFDSADYEAGDRRSLIRLYPQVRHLIRALTR